MRTGDRSRLDAQADEPVDEVVCVLEPCVPFFQLLEGSTSDQRPSANLGWSVGDMHVRSMS